MVAPSIFRMEIPFINPVTSILLFLQLLFLFLHYEASGFWAKDHWSVYLLPTFVGLIFLVVILASAALFESRRRPRDGDVLQVVVSHVMFQMLTAVAALFTWLLLILFLDEDTDLPSYWITTSLFVTTILALITLIAYYMHMGEYHPYGIPRPFRPRSHIYVGVLAFVQGLFLWLYVSPWGKIMKVPVAIVVLPSMLFLLSSFVNTLKQTYMHRNESGVCKIKQYAFMFMILVGSYTFMAIVVNISDPDIGWSEPQWAILPSMIYSALLVPVSIYVYYMERKFTDPEPQELQAVFENNWARNPQEERAFAMQNVYGVTNMYNPYNMNDSVMAATAEVVDNHFKE